MPTVDHCSSVGQLGPAFGTVNLKFGCGVLLVPDLKACLVKTAKSAHPTKEGSSFNAVKHEAKRWRWGASTLGISPSGQLFKQVEIWLNSSLILIRLLTRDNVAPRRSNKDKANDFKFDLNIFHNFDGPVSEEIKLFYRSSEISLLTFICLFLEA